MKKPRPEDFDPQYKTRTFKPEEVDLSDAVAIKPKHREDEPTKSENEISNTKQATTTPSNHDTTVSRYHDSTIETIRKSVKEIGKEAATHRFTNDEKQRIADIVYAYKRQGIRTSENELTRIAINYLIEEHNQRKDNSLLDQVLKALNE